MRVDLQGYGFNIHRWPATVGSPQAVLLHGFAGTGRDWEPVRPAFTSMDAFPLDLPGHNHLPVPRDASWETLRDAFDQLLDGASLARPAWVGYSYGARLALRYALERPERVGRLVLLSPHPGLAPAEREARRLKDQEDAERLAAGDLEDFLARWHAGPAFETRRRRDDWQAYVERQKATNDPASLAGCLRVFGLGAQPDLRPRLREIAAPTLLIAGFEDRAYNEAARLMQLVMPRARRATLAGVGHAPHQEAPEATARLIQDFLATPFTVQIPRDAA